jgi:hypothetical protein
MARLPRFELACRVLPAGFAQLGHDIGVLRGQPILQFVKAFHRCEDGCRDLHGIGFHFHIIPTPPLIRNAEEYLIPVLPLPWDAFFETPRDFSFSYFHFYQVWALTEAEKDKRNRLSATIQGCPSTTLTPSW